MRATKIIPLLAARRLAARAAPKPNRVAETEAAHNYSGGGVSGNRLSRLLPGREAREETYKVVGSCLGLLAFGWGMYEHAEDTRERRMAQRAQLGRELVLAIENTKAELYGMTIEFVRGKETEAFDKAEKTFGHILRRLSTYDNEVVPEIIKIETEYQLQRLRRLIDVHNEGTHRWFAAEDKKSARMEVIRCLHDIYEVINIASVVASAKTSRPGSLTEDEELILEKIKSVKTIDELRLEVYTPMKIRQFNDLHKEKVLFWGQYEGEAAREILRRSVDFDFAASMSTKNASKGAGQDDTSTKGKPTPEKCKP